MLVGSQPVSASRASSRTTGTVTSTYVRGNGTLTITHEATGFKANGASISGKRVVVYTKSGTLITKHRTGTWTGTTKKGKDFSHDADFTVTYDTAAKCISSPRASGKSATSRCHPTAARLISSQTIRHRSTSTSFPFL